MRKKQTTNLLIHLLRIASVAVVVQSLAVSNALALNLVTRVLTIGNSNPSAVTSYAFSFKPGTSGNIGAIEIQLCDSPLSSVGCVNTGVSSGVSFTSNSANLASQGGISGFTAGTGTPPAPTVNTFWLTNGTPQNINNATTITFLLQNVRNASATNTQYYARITTFSDSGGSVQVDYGAMAISTDQAITVSGTMPESLTFCVGTSGTDCGNMTGSTVNLGTFSPATASTGTSLMSASTNAGQGYSITLLAGNLSSGANTISAMGTQSANSAGCSPSCSSTVGTSQFGMNLAANATPSIGSSVSGLGSGAAYGGYAAADSFRFFSGDIVATVGAPTKNNLYTTSYIVNVSPDQAAGLYSTTVTYICTGSF